MKHIGVGIPNLTGLMEINKRSNKLFYINRPHKIYFPEEFKWSPDSRELKKYIVYWEGLKLMIKNYTL